MAATRYAKRDVLLCDLEVPNFLFFPLRCLPEVDLARPGCCFLSHYEFCCLWRYVQDGLFSSAIIVRKMSSLDEYRVLTQTMRIQSGSGDSFSSTTLLDMLVLPAKYSSPSSTWMCFLGYEHQLMLTLHSRPHRKLKVLPDNLLDNGHDLYRNLPQLAHDLSAAYLTYFEKEFNDNIKKIFLTETLQQSCLKLWFDYFDSTLRLLWLSDLQRPCAFALPYM
uniref:Uncharacterized protein n=1 Tax=Glossina palpalis gambiensis TaxID=67801 RepID=A0A1B0BPN3_9MUSC